jgi:thiol peroxidase
MGGNPITLAGPKLNAGDPAPDFMVLDNDLMPKILGDFEGKTKLISVVVSLDVSVGDAQTRKFNEAAADFGDDVAVLTISADLPFTQKRWCGNTGIDRVVTLSDHRDIIFGLNYGVLIKELRLLNRAVFIIDKDNVIRYAEIVEENHNHPDYQKALEALKTL